MPPRHSALTTPQKAPRAGNKRKRVPVTPPSLLDAPDAAASSSSPSTPPPSASLTPHASPATLARLKTVVKAVADHVVGTQGNDRFLHGALSRVKTAYQLRSDCETKLAETKQALECYETVFEAFRALAETVGTKRSSVGALMTGFRAMIDDQTEQCKAKQQLFTKRRNEEIGKSGPMLQKVLEAVKSNQQRFEQTLEGVKRAVQALEAEEADGCPAPSPSPSELHLQTMLREQKERFDAERSRLEEEHAKSAAAAAAVISQQAAALRQLEAERDLLLADFASPKRQRLDSDADLLLPATQLTRAESPLPPLLCSFDDLSPAIESPLVF